MEGPSCLKMKLLTIWSSGQSVLDQNCFGLKDFQTEVGIWPKYHWGQSILWAELCLELEYVWGQSECGAKVVLGPHCV